MSATTMTAQSTHLSLLDDELAALEIQLEELGLQSQVGKGKYPVGQPPDFEVAFTSFQAELLGYMTFLNDQKLAQSIGAAVHSDGLIIGDLTSQEAQSHEDRRLALNLSNRDPEVEAPLRTVGTEVDNHIPDRLSAIRSTMAATSIIEWSDDESVAGPSMTFTERQADIMTKLGKEFHCTACTDRFPRSVMVTAKCSHRYCGGCMKELFLRSTKDESYYPPKCCKQPIPVTLAAKHMNPDELTKFKLAIVEYATTNRTYCSNLACGRFVPPSAIESGTNRAICPNCATATCAICKSAYHHRTDCPEDPSLRQTRDLAREMGWQTCNNCDRVVQLRSGCNHMTCPCGAEFCYVCGVRWKECSCPNADLHRIEERAEEIVQRDAGPNLPPAERRQHVNRVFHELQNNHECEHSRHFKRVTEGGPRRGFRCELCDHRHHKYILQCRLCYVNVCEDCRRHRI